MPGTLLRLGAFGCRNGMKMIPGLVWCALALVPAAWGAETDSTSRTNSPGAGPGPSADETAQRKPFVIEGRVTDEQGRGMERVTITAHCGIGTLLPTGEAKTGPDGHYTLRFGPGMRMKMGDRWGAGLQCATIRPARTGYAETNLHRQGGLMMAGEMPSPKSLEDFGTKPEQVVLPGKPYTLDFVMAPTATVTGVLTDASGKPKPGRRIYLKGKELLPSCSVLAGATTDEAGRFEVEGVPVRRAWWFSVDGTREPRSEPVIFPEAKMVEVKLRVVTREGKETLVLDRR